MMRKAFLLITVILGIVLCVYIWPVPMENMQIFAGSNKLNGINWFTLSESAQERIVYDYVNALDSFAMAMPIVGGDTESAWAADTVHTMTQRVKEGQRSFLESMSDIYQMQNYIAYGMSYFNAIVGLPHDTIMLCNYVLRDMLASSDSLCIRQSLMRTIETLKRGMS